MHFVTGGAFNGKRAWVLKRYQDYKWISAYEGEEIINDLHPHSCEKIVFEGIEIWLKEQSEKQHLDDVRADWKERLIRYADWERENMNRHIIFIGIDITKGIVPMEETDRNWRDVTGWVYQDLVQVCQRVDVIWYGINQTIKWERKEEN